MSATEYSGDDSDKIVFITGKDSNTKEWSPKVSNWRKLVTFMDEPRSVKECGGYCPVKIHKTESQCFTDDSNERRPHIGHHRTQAAIDECSLITLDADSADPNFLANIEDCGWSGLVHSTFSHDPAKNIHKFRALIRVSRSMTKDEKRIVTRQVMRELGWAQFDTTGASPEHFMYWPSVHPDRAEVRVFEELTGELLDVDWYTMIGEIEESRLKSDAGSPVTGVADLGVPPSPYELFEAERRLNEAVNDVSRQGEGNRNNVLMYQMSKLWPLVLGGCLDESDMIDRMTIAAENCGIGIDEFDYVSGGRRDVASAARPVAPFEPVDSDEPVGPGGVVADEECTWNDCSLSPVVGSTLCAEHKSIRDSAKAEQAALEILDYEPSAIENDLHLARRVAHEYLESRVRAWGKSGWAIWGGKKWDLNASSDKVMRMLHDAMLAIHKSEEKRARGEAAGDGIVYAARMKVVNRLLSAKCINDMSRMSRAYLTVDPSRFDGQHVRHFLNCQNGVVDLRTGELMPHKRDYYFTKIAQVEYRAGATHVDWVSAMRALPDDVMKYMQKRFGQAITGMPAPDDVIPFLKGGGANGKSTHVDSIGAALGGFFGHVPKDIIIEGRKHDSLLMEMKGVRFAVMEELPRNKWLDSTALKDVAGTGVMKSRPLFESYVYWQPTHCLFVTSNYETQVVETDWGTWRRLERIEYRFTFDGSDPDRPGDPGLRKRLQDGETGQHEAVLAWLVEGAQMFYAEGLERGEQPEVVKNDTLGWRSRGNPVVRFVHDMLIYAPGDASLVGDVFEQFKLWCEEANLRAGSDQTFWSRMSDTDLMRQPGVLKQKFPESTAPWRIYSTKEVKPKMRLLQGVRVNWDLALAPRGQQRREATLWLKGEEQDADLAATFGSVDSDGKDVG